MQPVNIRSKITEKTDKHCKRFFLDNLQHLSREVDGDTPLIMAVMTGDLDKVKMLVTLGKQHAKNYHKFINHARSGDKKTALHVAASFLNPEIVEYLLNAGAAHYKKDYFGDTPMHCAVLFGCNSSFTSNGKTKAKQIITALIDSGADINCTNKDLETPLFNASGGDWCYKIAKFCICYGARLDCRNKYGQCPIDYAKSRTNSENIIDLYQSYMQKLQKANPSTMAPAKEPPLALDEIAKNDQILGVQQDLYDTIMENR